MKNLCLLVVSCVLVTSAVARLSVRGNAFYVNGKKTFLMGSNIAWYRYGFDFGNGQWRNARGSYNNWMKQLSAAGANSIRVWIHTDGRSTPQFDSSGFVTAADRHGTIIDELKDLLRIAKQYNILVFPVLWNGAAKPPQQLINLFWDDAKLKSYIDKALRPMVRALRGNTALGGWEVINEPEGSIRLDSTGSQCTDTSNLGGSGAGWAKGYIPMKNVLRFVNWMASAIHDEDSSALVTVGTWSEKSNTNAFSGLRNYYSDTCLRQAGGKYNGILNFYQMHTYAHGGRFSKTSPLKISSASFKLRKPIVIGEFSARGGDSRSLTTLFSHAYTQGYGGAWTWQVNESDSASDKFTSVLGAIRSLSYRTDRGQIKLKLN